jgi:hypothetical protein
VSYDSPQLLPLLLTRTSSSGVFVSRPTLVQTGCIRTSGAFLELVGYALQLFFFVEVGGNVVCFALAERIQLFAGLFAGFCVARGDVDCGAILDKAFTVGC